MAPIEGEAASQWQTLTFLEVGDAMDGLMEGQDLHVHRIVYLATYFGSGCC